MATASPFLPTYGSADGLALLGDTVTAAMPAGEEAAATQEEAAQSPSSWRRSHRQQTDTLPPDPREMRPLAPGQPLTMKPEALEGDYWESALTHLPKSKLAQQLDSLAGRADSTLIGTAPHAGMAGDPVPYQFRSDSLVTSLLMLSFFMAAWVISRSRRYLHKQIKDFFRHRDRENLFAERTESEMQGQAFLIFQTCLVLGTLFFDYTQECQTEVFNQVSPYKILASSVGIFCTFYLVKTILYHVVNSVFFNRKQRQQWSASYLLSILALGVALLPVSLLVVYFDLSLQHTAIVFIALLAVDKILLVYKCSRIFFNYPFGLLHLFLYFCTLEIAPIFVLFRILVYANNLLLTLNQ